MSLSETSPLLSSDDEEAEKKKCKAETEHDEQQQQQKKPEELELEPDTTKAKVQVQSTEPGRKKRRRRQGFFDFAPEESWTVGDRVHSSPLSSHEHAKTVLDLYCSGRSMSYADRAVGWRLEASCNMLLFLTYKDLFGRAHRLGSALLRLNSNAGADPSSLVPMFTKVGLFSASCVEWLVADLACCLLNLASVAICEHFSAEQLKCVLRQSKLEYVLVDSNKRAQLVLNAALDEPSSKLRHVIVVEHVEHCTKELASRALVLLHNFKQLWDDHDCEIVHPRFPDAGHRYSLNYSSSKINAGGEPVAVDLAHSNVVAAVQAFLNLPGVSLSKKDSYLSHVPLWVLQERCTVLAVLAAGGSVALHSAAASSGSGLLSDCVCLKPTVFCMTPRLARSLYATGLQRQCRTETSSCVLSANSKTQALLQTLGRSVAWLCGVDKYRPYAVQLGGAVRLILLSARCHFSPDLLCAMSTFLGTSIPILTVYGLSECTFMASAGFVNEKRNDAVSSLLGYAGRPVQMSHIKLTDALVAQQEWKAVQDRGEVNVRSDAMPCGKYYKDEQPHMHSLIIHTFVKERPDSRGYWIHTGDAAQWTTSQELRILGSIESVFTVNGEPVFPEQLEAVFSGCIYCVQAFVFDLGGAVGCLCVADRANAFRLAKSKKILLKGSTLAAFCQNRLFVETVRQELEALCAKYSLGEHAKPAAVAMVAEEFTVANGQLLATHRLNRSRVTKCHLDKIEELKKSVGKLEGDATRIAVESTLDNQK